MSRPSSAAPVQHLDVAIATPSKKFLMVVPKRVAIQSAIVAMVTANLLLDSKMVSRHVTKKSHA